MSSFLKNYKRLSGINENKLFGSNQTQQLVNKLGQSNSEFTTENIVNIFALFRNYKPFNTIKDVNTINSINDLNQLFNTWYNDTLLNIINSTTFNQNKSTAKQYFDTYIKNIGKLGTNAKPINLNDIEHTLVDICNNNHWIQNTVIKQDRDIYKPEDEDIVFQNENIVILKGDTKPKCINYGRGESWCIGKADLNYYTHYRITQGATIYFCLQPKTDKSNPEHKFVVMVYENGYGLADKTNDPSTQRHGGSEYDNHPYSWLISQIPTLSGLEKYFVYNPPTEGEINYSNLVSKRYEGDELMTYINTAIKDLMVNGGTISAKDFLRDYISNRNKISENQFKTLPEELRDVVIDSGMELFEPQFILLSQSQRNRYIKIRQENDLSLGSIINYLPEDLQIKELKLNAFFIKYIKNPSEAVQLEAVKNNAYGIKYINNPSEAVQLATVEEDGIAIQHIYNPSEAVQLKAVGQNSRAIAYIKNPSELVQFEAVILNSVRAIEYIENPSEFIQLEAVKKTIRAIDYIKNPTPRVLKYVEGKKMK